MLLYFVFICLTTEIPSRGKTRQISNITRKGFLFPAASFFAYTCLYSNFTNVFYVNGHDR